MRMHALVGALTALALLSGCALAPEFKAFFLSHREWRGTALNERGRLVVADAVAGSAPLTITLIEIGGVLELPADPAHRGEILNKRALNVAAELVRDGVAPADIGLDLRALALGVDRQPPPPLLARRMVIVVHYD